MSLLHLATTDGAGTSLKVPSFCRLFIINPSSSGWQQVERKRSFSCLPRLWPQDCRLVEIKNLHRLACASGGRQESASGSCGSYQQHTLRSLPATWKAVCSLKSCRRNSDGYSQREVGTVVGPLALKDPSILCCQVWRCRRRNRAGNRKWKQHAPRSWFLALRASKAYIAWSQAFTWILPSTCRQNIHDEVDTLSGRSETWC